MNDPTERNDDEPSVVAPARSRSVEDVEVVLMAGVTVGVVAVVGGTAWYTIRHRRHVHLERVRAVADRHGLVVDVTTKPPPSLAFDLFRQGTGRRVTDQMWRSGQPDSVFQYEYKVGSGQQTQTYRHTAALVGLPFVAPHLVISTENWWTRAKRVVGVRDVEVESPDFNSRYHVTCRDERFAITLLDPPMIAWMLSPQSGRGSITYEFGGSWLLCHGDQLQVEQLPGMLEWATSVRAQLPAVLSDLYRSR